MRHLVKTVVALAVLGAVPASAAAAPALPGVPSDASLLFALESGAGTLMPDTRAGKGRFTLTLRGVERRATWFTDRPQRNAGRVDTRKLFTAWRELGSYARRRRTARCAVRTLGSLGNGLRHINRRIDLRPPRRFGAASLFIDNATYSSGQGCTLGQPQLSALTGPLEGMFPANGQILSVRGNTALFQILGAQFGGDGVNTFALPDMDAPPNMAWFSPRCPRHRACKRWYA